MKISVLAFIKQENYNNKMTSVRKYQVYRFQHLLKTETVGKGVCTIMMGTGRNYSAQAIMQC